MNVSPRDQGSPRAAPGNVVALFGEIVVDVLPDRCCK